MDSLRLISDAWTTTWQSRRLWIFGLLAGATTGSLSIGRASLPDNLSPINLAPSSLGAVAIGVVGLLLLASVVARGGITQATLDLERGETASLRDMLSAGTHWFWPFLGLLVLLGIVSVAVLGMVVLAALNLGDLGAVIAAVVLTGGVVASIVLTYAERAIVGYNLGPRAALAYGWHLFRAHPGSSLLVWILNVGLAFAAAVAATVGLGTLWMFFGGLGVASVGATIALVVLMAAVANTFFWSYWTLAYVRLDSSS